MTTPAEQVAEALRPIIDQIQDRRAMMGPGDHQASFYLADLETLTPVLAALTAEAARVQELSVAEVHGESRGGNASVAPAAKPPINLGSDQNHGTAREAPVKAELDKAGGQSRVSPDREALARRLTQWNEKFQHTTTVVGTKDEDQNLLTEVIAALRAPAQAEVEEMCALLQAISDKHPGYISYRVDRAIALLRRLASPSPAVGEWRRAAEITREKAAQLANESAAEAERLRNRVPHSGEPDDVRLQLSRTSWLNTARALAAEIRAMPLPPLPAPQETKP